MNLPNRHFLLNGKYQLTQVVGQGGFGITYKGIWFTEVKGALGTVKTEVPVCIKEYFFKDYCYRDKENFTVHVHSETGKILFYKFREKLIKEAKILSEVHHPHIVNVLEVFEENNTAYIAMEYIEGCSLKYMLDKEGFLLENKVLKYIHQIGQALQFVHEKSILHLDIKPSNILIDRNDTARLIDFGVSKRYDLQEQETSTTMLTLSKGFASIEQYDDEGTQLFSPCPDIYSLGATLYNLLTGKIPVESILRATRPLQSPSHYNPAITAKTEEVIVKAMEIIPANRYQSVETMLQQLDCPKIEPGEKNLYLETAITTQNEETLLLGVNSNVPEQDEERTEILHSEIQKTVPVRKRRKSVLVASLFGIVVAAASAVIIFVGNDKEIPDNTILADVFSTESLVNVDEEDENDVPEEVINEPPSVTEVAPVPTHSVTPELTDSSIENQLDSNENKPENTDITGTPAEDILSSGEMDIRYSELLSSGNLKMENEDFEGAHTDFNAAKQLKVTEEVVRLIVESEIKMEEVKLANRFNQYEEKLALGIFKIVRKKSTGLYGAIDENGYEHITCKYIGVDKADNGRAFQREDNLFDVYNNNGILVNEGVTYY